LKTGYCGAMFEPKRNEKKKWKRFHNEGRLILYHSLNIVRVIKF
jgi:hypothetical protein